MPKNCKDAVQISALVVSGIWWYFIFMFIRTVHIRMRGKKDEVDAVSVDNSMGAVLLYVVALDHWNDWS